MGYKRRGEKLTTIVAYPCIKWGLVFVCLLVFLSWAEHIITD